MAVGVFPGSFNPPTVAHLAIARAAVEQCRLTRVDLVLSHDALGKADRDLVPVADRARVLDAVARSRPWLGVVVTDHRLIVDIATGYDVVVLGADKWAQVCDPVWYGGDTIARDDILTRLPMVAGVPRPGAEIDGVGLVLDVHHDHRPVSATAVRAGRADWMLAEAADFDRRTGAWSDLDRFRAWRADDR